MRPLCPQVTVGPRKQTRMTEGASGGQTAGGTWAVAHLSKGFRHRSLIVSLIVTLAVCLMNNSVFPPPLVGTEGCGWTREEAGNGLFLPLRFLLAGLVLPGTLHWALDLRPTRSLLGPFLQCWRLGAPRALVMLGRHGGPECWSSHQGDASLCCSSSATHMDYCHVDSIVTILCDQEHFNTDH